MEKETFVDYYELLGIKIDSTAREIRSAYRKVALKYHPDKAVIDSEKAAELFRGLTAAVDVLNDPEERAKYDRVYTSKKNAQLRFQALNSDIRQKRIDLELRENLAKEAAKSSRDQASARARKIARVRAENIARMREEFGRHKLGVQSILHRVNKARLSRENT